MQTKTKFRSHRLGILTLKSAWLRLAWLRLALAGVVICLTTLTEIASACPTCKDGLHDDGTAFAYAFSILFMMAMPFAIFTVWVSIILRLRSQTEPLDMAALEAQLQTTGQFESRS